MRTIALYFLLPGLFCIAYAQRGSGDSGSYPIPGSQILAQRSKALKAKRLRLVKSCAQLLRVATAH